MYDQGLAERLRELLADRPTLTERGMFGGIVLMLWDNMSVWVLGDEHDAAVDRPHTRVFDFTGWPTKGLVMVGADGSNRTKR